MSAQLVARGLATGHGTRTLFADLDLVLAPGHVLGVVGPNGAGKSTLLRLLAGSDEPTAGSVTRTPPSATVGLLPQETDRRPGESVAAHLARRTGVAAAQEELDAATSALAEGSGGADDRYSLALEHWLALGAADLDDRAGAVAAQVGLDVGLDQDMTTLSGGQAARVSLAVVLLSRFDVLLLDEPTNDLDLSGLALLEDLVRRTDAAVAVISHDREFLARTVTEVLELDLHQQQWHLHGGGYDAYLRRARTATRRRPGALRGLPRDRRRPDRAGSDAARRGRTRAPATHAATSPRRTSSSATTTSRPASSWRRRRAGPTR